METAVYRPLYDMLSARADLGFMWVTDGIGKAIDAHSLHMDIKNEGGLIIVDTGDKVHPIELKPPTADDRVGPIVGIRVRLMARHKAYLEPLTDASNLDDLVDFWCSAVRFHSELETHHAAGHDMYTLLPGAGLRMFSIKGILDD
ncbi:MAG TPA: hypothetical protein VLE73_03110 [Candidatus Saccharimonadales bacterium]|nr:hypothetical protein [Candidatus Saccharimonadales bacterium]